MFSQNENTADRVIRVVLGAALVTASFVALGITSGAGLGIAAAAVGAILLVTGAIGFCPLYRLLGISTCKTCQ